MTRNDNYNNDDNYTTKKLHDISLHEQLLFVFSYGMFKIYINDF